MFLFNAQFTCSIPHLYPPRTLIPSGCPQTPSERPLFDLTRFKVQKSIETEREREREGNASLLVSNSSTGSVGNTSYCVE